MLVPRAALQGSTKRRKGWEASPLQGGRKGPTATPHLDSLRAALAAAEEYELSAEDGSSERGDAAEKAAGEGAAEDMALGGEGGAPGWQEVGAPGWQEAEMVDAAFPPGEDHPPGKPSIRSGCGKQGT